MTRWLLWMLALLLPTGPVAAAGPRAPLVLAAASLQESMHAAADDWARRGHPRPVLSFAASSALARQLLAGARADLFVSADPAWMDAVERRGLLASRTRSALLGNRLVLVTSATATAMPAGSSLTERFGSAGRIAMADPESVPAGRYAKAALVGLGVWPRLAPRVVRAESVRAALALVARGAAPLGIVYATDARAARNVRIAAYFPPNSHPPIRYVLARLKASRSADAEGFRRYLLSPRGKAIFRRFGFVPL